VCIPLLHLQRLVKGAAVTDLVNGIFNIFYEVAPLGDLLILREEEMLDVLLLRLDKGDIYLELVLFAGIRLGEGILELLDIDPLQRTSEMRVPTKERLHVALNQEEALLLRR
jgi:hypothetical protein